MLCAIVLAATKDAAITELLLAAIRVQNRVGLSATLTEWGPTKRHHQSEKLDRDQTKLPEARGWFVGEVLAHLTQSPPTVNPTRREELEGKASGRPKIGSEGATQTSGPTRDVSK